MICSLQENVYHCISENIPWLEVGIWVTLTKFVTRYCIMKNASSAF